MLDLTGKSLSELLTIANDELNQLNVATVVEDRDARQKNIEDIVSKYNAKAKAECYAYLRNQDEPLKAAILAFYYEGIKFVIKTSKDTDEITRSIEKVSKPIDISDFWKSMKETGKECGKDHMWYYMAEKLNYHLVVRAAESVGKSAVTALFKKYADKHYMTEIARKIDMGKTPTSNSNILRVVQSVVTAMIGDAYKVTSRDIKALDYTYARENKKTALGITLPNGNTFRGLLKRLCYRILTNADGYDLDIRGFNMKKALEEEEAENGAKSAPVATPAPAVPVDTEEIEDNEETAAE